MRLDARIGQPATRLNVRRGFFVRLAVRTAIVAVVGLLLPTGAVSAQDPNGKATSSREEEARRKLLRQMGLEKKSGSRTEDAATTSKSEGPRAPQTVPPSPASQTANLPAPAEGSGPAVVKSAAPVFIGAVHEALLARCRACHSAAGPAAATRFVMSGQLNADHAAVRGVLDLAHPARSLLLTKATSSVPHGGGPTLVMGDDVYRRVLVWIAGGGILADRTAAAPNGVAAKSPLILPRAAPAAKPMAGAAAPATAEPDPARLHAAPVSAAVVAPPVATSAEAIVPAVATSSQPDPAAIAFHPYLVRSCLPCHQAGGAAANSRLLFTGTLASDLAAAGRFVDATRSADSPLASKSRGDAHGGGPVWTAESDGARVLTAWLMAGAETVQPTATPGTPLAPEIPGTATPIPPSPSDAVSAPTARFAPLGPTVSVNGRFDVNFERRGFYNNPFADGGSTAIQSHHHFVFLNRLSADDPFTFTAEITSLLFYEAGARIGPARGKHRFHLRAGKLLVPFGNEPLFHQSYGGHTGLDQKVLPAVWASEGLAVTGRFELGRVTATGDIYVVRGHALRRPDAVLSLQNDLSPVDDAKPALGVRTGAFVGALSGFYSAYFNPLGQQRRLLLQAIDVSLWRWAGVPLLDRLVLGMGVLRADVSGGGAGVDHYHFASYWMARVYAREWLSLQYRQGLRTFGNKRGFIFDQSRAGAEDGSTHNFAVVVRTHGLSVTLAYFLNFEKADEIDDDLLRLVVAYEF